MADTNPDVLIIGGGIVGLTSAYYLARGGASVVLLEQQELASGSSHGNAGLLCPCHSTPIPGPGVLTQGLKWLLDPESPFYVRFRLDRQLLAWLWRFQSFCNQESVHRAIPVLRDMQRASLVRYRQLVEEEQIDCYFQPSGGLTLYKTARKWREADQEIALAQQYGLDTVALDQAQLRALEPAVHRNVIGALHHREDAHLDPALFMIGLGKAVARLGVKIYTHSPVTRLESQAGPDGGMRVVAVYTTDQVFRPTQVVVAAGAWSANLIEGLPVRILLQPAKGYSITIKRPPVSPVHHLHLAEARAAVTPLGPHLRFAGTLELTGIDHTINQRRVGAIHRNVQGYLQDETDLTAVEIWGGMRPCSPDGLPYIGRTRAINNLILATGHAMLGMSMGPATGALVAQLAAEQAPFLDLSMFTVERFN